MTSSEASTTGISLYFAFAREDEAIQKKLEKQLSSLKRAYGVTCWHRYMVAGGEEIQHEVEKHLQCATVILLLISPDYLASGAWYTLEVTVAMQRFEAGSARVIPILLRPVAMLEEAPFAKIQGFPRNDRPISELGTRKQAAFAEIAEEIGALVKTLPSTLSRPGSRLMARSFPPSLSPLIQRRSKVVQQIYNRLAQPETSAVVLTGIGGAGKSTLANLTYHLAQKRFEAGAGPFTAAPIWFEINPSFTMDDLLRGICDALDIPRTAREMLLPQEQALVLFQALNSAKPRFIVLDQFEYFIDARTREVSPEHAGVRAWLTLLNENACVCRVLLTSRLNIDNPVAGHIRDFPVFGLETTEGIAFLKKSLQVHGIKPPEAQLREAVERCRRHPLSLGLLVSLLKEYTNLNLNLLLYDPLYAEYWKGAIASRLLDLIYWRQLDQTQRELLLAFSIFREPVTIEAAAAIQGIFDVATMPPKQLLQALAVLRNLHLLEDAPVLRCYQLHPIVASYARDRFDERSEQASGVTLADAHRTAAECYQQQAEKTGISREQRQKLLNFVEAAWHWCQAKRQQTAYELICQKALFATLQRSGDNATLFKLYSELFPLAAWQPQPLQAAQLHNEYGEIQSALGQTREAESSFAQAVAGFRALGNLEGQVNALNNLGATHRKSGMLESALSCYQEALRICSAMESPYLHGKATSLNNIGVISLYFGQIERALEFFEQALPLQQAVQDQGEEARTRMNIGRVYDIQKKSDKAYQHYQQALHIFRATGDRDGQAAVYNQLGIYYTKNPGKTPEKKREARQEAEKQHMLALRIFQEIGDREQEAITLQRLGRLAFFSYAIDNNSYVKEDFEKPLAFYLRSRQIYQELHMPEKGKIPKLVSNELQARLGAEQLATLIEEIEFRARQMVEQVVGRGHLLR